MLVILCLPMVNTVHYHQQIVYEYLVMGGGDERMKMSDEDEDDDNEEDGEEDVDIVDITASSSSQAAEDAQAAGTSWYRYGVSVKYLQPACITDGRRLRSTQR